MTSCQCETHGGVHGPAARRDLTSNAGYRNRKVSLNRFGDIGQFDNLIGGARLDGRFGDAVDRAAGRVLGEHATAASVDDFATCGSVSSHAGQDHCQQVPGER